ncbi:MAG: peptidoglycan DD-metalloendopeptidase family protein [Myxococcota bacterium]
MSFERNPVPGSPPPLPLQCKDFDPITGEQVGSECRKQQQAHHERMLELDPEERKKLGRFDCTKHGTGRKNCNRRTFLYPRKVNKKGNFHVHQGIDLFPGPLSEGRPSPDRILSVTSGQVCCVLEWDGVTSGYGNVIAVYNDRLDMTFWYAHCKAVFFKEGETVREQELIAIVGNTGFAGGLHLHFEVHRGKSKHPLRGERTPYDEGGSPRRLNPHIVLESLGPWGATQLFLPGGTEVEDATVAELHKEVETSREGGCFPLGANNLWHGGVHVRTPPRADLHAPFDGDIVAIRLDPDPATAMGRFGSMNFVLMRHEISESIFERLQRKEPGEPEEPEQPAPTRPPAVGRRSSNPPDRVAQVEQRLRELLDEHGQPFYAFEGPALLEDGKLRREFQDAIEAFQSTLDSPYSPSRAWPDGKISIGGYTWRALFPEGPPGTDDPETPEIPPPAEEDPTRVVFSLFMHVGAVPIDAALVSRIRWLEHARIPGGSKPADDDDARAEHQADLEEAKYRIETAVGRDPDEPGSEGAPADIEWVQRRLQRHTSYRFHEATEAGVFSDALDRAIRDFQAQFVPFFARRGHAPDGIVGPRGSTRRTLAKPATELKPAGVPVVDPEFLAAIEARDEAGHAAVVSGLKIPVAAKDVLWVAGQTQAILADGSGPMRSMVHWEIFSEHQVMGAWDDAKLEDTTLDLSLDVPEQLFDLVETLELPGVAKDDFITPLEMVEFYAGEDAKLLRQTPCRFLSEWGLDLPAAVAAVARMGFDTSGLEADLEPYLWWNAAADVLPASPIVWHYNPIELARVYQGEVDALKPREFDDTTHPTLVVRVLFDNGVLMPKATVSVIQGGATIASGRTLEDGERRFRGLPVGSYEVLVDGSSVASHRVELSGGPPTLLEVETTVPGPPPKRGTIFVNVRKEHTGLRPRFDVAVSLREASGAEVATGVAKRGKAAFESVEFGDYVLHAGEATPVEITLDRKKKTASTLVLPPPIRTLTVQVLVDGEPGARRPVKVVRRGRDGGATVTGLTDDGGVARFELPVARYNVFVGEHSRKVKVAEEASANKPLVFRLSAADAPGPVVDPDEGSLAVTVVDHEEPERSVPDLFVVVEGTDGTSEGQFTDVEGTAIFELAKGRYDIDVNGETARGEVQPGRTTAVTIEVEL